VTYLMHYSSLSLKKMRLAVNQGSCPLGQESNRTPPRYEALNCDVWHPRLQ